MAVAYETAEYNISIKHGNDIRDIRWTVKDADSVAYDFSNRTDISLKVYDYAGGEELLSRPQSSTAGVITSAEIVLWNDVWSDIGLARGDYYYWVEYEDSVLAHPTVKVIDGTLTII